MGGGTLHLKVLRREGGGAQAVLEIWVESGWMGGGGVKILCLMVGWGYGFLLE